MKKRRIRVTLGVTINAGNYQNYRPEVELSARLDYGESYSDVYGRLAMEAHAALASSTLTLMQNEPEWKVRDALKTIGLHQGEIDGFISKRDEVRAGMDVAYAQEGGQEEQALVQGDDGVVASSDEVYDECADCGDPADASDFDDYDEDDFDPDDEEEVERDDFGGEIEDPTRSINVTVTEDNGKVTTQDVEITLPEREDPDAAEVWVEANEG